MWSCRAPLSDFAPLWARLPVVSLQVGCDRHQVEGTDVIDVLPAEPDLADVAALIGNCRAVVSAQWTVSHLTSAMGVELHLGFHDVWPHPRCVQEWAHHQQDDCMRPPEPDDFVETATQPCGGAGG